MRRRRRNALTLIGVLAIAGGWVILLFGRSAGQYLAAFRPDVSLLWPAGVNAAVIANALILSGFGLAILGALQQGFGALNRFFDAVLGSIPAQESKPDRATIEFEAALAAPEPVRPAPVRKPPRPPVRPPGVANYIVRDDGTTEVETLLGVRRFASEKEAREFLGA